jgi:hypothetical protein
MTWHRRFVELVCAGGTLAGCLQHRGIPCGNADPDPCICGRSPPDTPRCRAEQQCDDSGGFWQIDLVQAGSAGIAGECVLPDAGVILDAGGKPDGAP